MTLVDMVAVVDHINDHLVLAFKDTDLVTRIEQTPEHGNIRIRVTNPHGILVANVEYLHGGYRMGQLEFLDTTELVQYVANRARRHFSV
jgi:hypothetical protein